MRRPLASVFLLALSLGIAAAGSRLPGQTPVLSGIAPQSFRQGMPTRTTLTGTNLGGVTSVQVDTQAGQNLKIVSATEVRFDMPTAAQPSESTQIKVTAPAGSSNSLFVTRQEPRQLMALQRTRLQASGEATGVAFGDVDGDGDLDLVVGTGVHNSSATDLFLNNGYGEFTKDTTGRIPQVLDHTESVVLADLDGDRDLDLIIVNTTYAGTMAPYSRILLNDGTGHFTDVSSTHLPAAIVLSAYRAAVGDVDRDGDLDIYFALRGGGETLLLNDGTAHFKVSTGLPNSTLQVTGAVFADVDGDRDLDLVRVTARPAIYINDGTGKFTDETATRFSGTPRAEVAVVAVDVDGDGDLDLAFATGVLMSQWQVESLWLNDGQGKFRDVTATNMPTVQSNSNNIAAGDLDGDGHPDLLIVVASGNTDVGGRNLLFLNDGTGKFIDDTLPRTPLDGPINFAAALGDVDRDGDLDVAIGSENGVSLYANAAWHAFAAAPPVRGEPWVIELYSRAGYATAARPMLPILSFRPLVPPVSIPPFGLLGIDLTSGVVLPTVALSTPWGAGFVRLDVPDQAVLVGLPLFIQALTLPATESSSWRLTGVVTDRIQ